MRDVHPWKVILPIDVIDEGRIIFVSDVNCLKVDSPINGIAAGIVCFWGMYIDRYHILQSMLLIWGGVMSLSGTHPLKAWPPTKVNDVGRWMFMRDVHYLNTDCPIDVAGVGRMILTSDAKSLKVWSTIEVTDEIRLMFSSDAHSWKAARLIEVTSVEHETAMIFFGACFPWI